MSVISQPFDFRGPSSVPLGIAERSTYRVVHGLCLRYLSQEFGTKGMLQQVTTTPHRARARAARLISPISNSDARSNTAARHLDEAPPLLLIAGAGSGASPRQIG